MKTTTEENVTSTPINATAWQRQVKPGDLVLREVDSTGAVPFYSFSEVLTDEEEGDPPDGWVFTRTFNAICPEGEYGDAAISTFVAPLTRAQFELARRLGWPSRITFIRMLIGWWPRQGGDA